jgi:uncharacterized protein
MMRFCFDTEAPMTAIALAGNIPFSVITISDGRRRPPVWKSLLGLPRFGDADIAYAGATAPQRNLWAAQLDRAVTLAERPVLLVAHGAGCFAAAWWARLSPASYVERVGGALLFDPIGRGSADDVASRYASPPTALPFPTALIRAAPLGAAEAPLQALAAGWGSTILDLPAAPSLAGGATAWHQAHALLLRVTARVVERDLRVADVLGFSLDRQD